MLRNRGIVHVYLILSAAGVFGRSLLRYIQSFLLVPDLLRFKVSYFAQAFIIIYYVMEKCAQLTFNDVSTEIRREKKVCETKLAQQAFLCSLKVFFIIYYILEKCSQLTCIDAGRRM